MIKTYRRSILSILLCCFATAVPFSWIPSYSDTCIAKEYPLLIAALGAGIIYECTHRLGDHRYRTHCQLDQSDCIAIPHELHNLTHYEFVQVDAARQEGPSCSWYAVIHAKAMQHLITNRKKISASNIRQQVSAIIESHVLECEAYLKNLLDIDQLFTGLKIHHVPALASHLGVHTYYDLCLRKKQEGMFVSTDCACAVLEDTVTIPEGFATKYVVWDARQLLKEIKRNTAPIVHILLTVPSCGSISHAVAITIITRPNKKPLLLLMNSNGNDLQPSEDDPAATTEAAHIVNFIKSLDTA